MHLHSCVWNAGPNAHDTESVLLQSGNILKGITGGVHIVSKNLVATSKFLVPGELHEACTVLWIHEY